MPNSESLNKKLEEISRKFVHRHNIDQNRGYSQFTELIDDVQDCIVLLRNHDHIRESDSGYSEYWIRIFNDLTSYAEEWPLDRHSDTDVERFVVAVRNISPEILKRANAFTQTQRTRLLSIALRTREVTMLPVATEIIDSFGSTLSLEG